jgi:hypothetical protein
MNEENTMLQESNNSNALAMVQAAKNSLHYDQDSGIFTWIKSANNKVKVGSRAGTKEKRGYIIIQLNKKTIKAHRLAWLMVHGSFPNGEVDHIDNNPSNNRISNLRVVNRSKNQMNARPPVHNKSGFKGVHFCKSKNKWVATIGKNGKKEFIGYFNDFESAKKSRLKEESNWQKEYAYQY